MAILFAFDMCPSFGDVVDLSIAVAQVRAGSSAGRAHFLIRIARPSIAQSAA